MSIDLKTSSDVFAFINEQKGSVQKMTKDVLVQIGNALIEGSPVGNPATWVRPPHKDYSPGQFIDNWQVGIDNEPQGMINTQDPSAEGSKSRLSKLGRWQVGHTYFFVNNVPYALALEQGHSGQAPNGVVALTEMRISEFVRNAEQNLQNEKLDAQFLGSP